MGFKVRRVYKLTFAEPDLEGLEVRARSLSVEKILDVMERANDIDVDNASKEQITELFDLFADALVSWNCEEDDDQPVSATVAGLLSLDLRLAMRIIMAWLNVVTDIPAPLEKPSADGSSSVEASIPMEPLLASPPN